ncbi:MAG: alpha/beta hydrolase [Gammaproteobacteria bacterium]|nr:alpha/beta hydrolase [Gammaproteobacteria bacterium]MYD76480.1 alpha/beta hydrolase [Gammaproteobacteria bacterium]MYJ51905.1 alpha/beta hydrolase [Gammaproteobacteria bacterium]
MSVKELVLEGLTGPLAGLEAGAPDGDPLVCLHGWLDNAASFGPLAERLPNYRWICVDLPGHGKSAYRPDGAVYHYTDYLGDVYRVLESLELERCTLVGHSLGAGIAAVFAAAFPSMVDRLVMIDGIGPIAGDSGNTLEQLRESLEFLGRNDDTGPRFYPSWNRVVERRLQAGDISRTGVETLLSRGAVRKGEGTVVLSDGRLKQRSPLYMSQQKVVSILAGIEAPALLIIARQGLIANRATTTERIAAIPDLTQEAVAGGHHVHLDDPAAMASVIDRFLEDRKGGT